MSNPRLLTIAAYSLGHALGLLHAVGAAPGTALSAAEIIKVQWDTRDLTAADLDEDGRLDLALINNDDARIDLYYQLAPGEKPGETERKTSVDRWEPVLSDARFERVKILTGGIAFDLALGDLNHDKKTDLVYTNDRDELVVHHQGEEGDWPSKQYFEFDDLSTYTAALWVGDLLGDQKNDLLCLTNDGLMLFPDGDLDQRPQRYTCVYEDPAGLTVRDLNGDGQLDIIYYYINLGRQSAMAVRFQSDEHTFVSERFFNYKRSVNLPVPINWSENGKQSFVAVSAANRTLVQLEAGEDSPTEPGEGSPKRTASDEKRDFHRVAYAVPSAGAKASSLYALADFNGDQKLDVVASDGPGAQVWFFQQTDAGDLRAPESFPAFSDINGLAAGDVDGDQSAELIMSSAKEGVLGVAYLSEEGRFAYPEVIPLDRAPELMTAGDIDGDQITEIICAVEGDSRRERALLLVKRGQTKGSWLVEPLTDQSVGSRLQGLQLADIDQDGKQDVLVTSRVQPLEVLLQQADGTFKPAESNVAGLADKVAPEAISQGDLDADGEPELLVTRETFARSARLGPQGRAQVIEQINAPDVSASLLVSLAADTDGDDKPELLLIDGYEAEIHVMARDDKGVYRLLRSHPGVSEITGSRVTDADADGTPDLFLFGKSDFWWYRLRPDTFAVEERQIYETDLKDTIYAQLVAGALDGDERDDLVVFDIAQNHVMELLLTSDPMPKEQRLRSALHFKLFEADPHFQGQRGGRFQPHGSVLADLNADGRNDIAVLMHDRLIIYPQQ